MHELQEAPGEPRFATVVHTPLKLSSIETDQVDPLGRPIRVACVSCHSQKEPGELPTAPDDLEEFHQGLTLNHGDLSCRSCHAPERHDLLVLAGGERVEMTDAMRLCTQCHGPQARDYRRGSHGGVTGYWDRSRGPQYRNNCVSCHDPHAPQFPSFHPVHAPRGSTPHPVSDPITAKEDSR